MKGRSRMFENITDVQITGMLHGNATIKRKITNRPSHTLVYKISGETLYYLREKKIRHSGGTVLFIPEGETFSFEKTSEGESQYYLINFHCAALNGEEPRLFLPQAHEHISYLFSQMKKSWLFEGNDAARYELLSLFYRLISVLLQSQSKDYHTAAQNARLKPATEYLENNLYSHELTISHLASRCGISEVSFRSLFAANFGESPKKYIIRRRLMRAKTIIESGEYTSIGEVSQMVGYNDPLYFSRHFKNYFGYSPSKI